MPKLIDLSGQRFGRLTVIERAENKGHKTAWLCECDCGNAAIIRGCDLKSSKIRSCGCLHSEATIERNVMNATHGGRGTRLYRIWHGVKTRCQNANNKDYMNYGGRGIAICDEWAQDFASFRDWALGNGYSDKLTIDRIDVNGNYCPENCRWVDVATQNRNKRKKQKNG